MSLIARVPFAGWIHSRADQNELEFFDEDGTDLDISIPKEW